LGDYYVLFQWAYSEDFGIGVGSPAVCNASATTNGVGMAVAFRIDGGNPWGGTTGSPGSDTKGTPVWIDGGSQVVVIDPGCETGIGAFGTNKENLLMIYSAGAASIGRVHMVGDEDNFYILGDYSNNDGYDRLAECSLFQSFANYPCSYPLMVRVQTSGTIPLVNNWYGSSTGSASYNGGIVGPDGDGNKACQVYPYRMNGLWNSDISWSPNTLYSAQTWSEYPHWLQCHDYQQDGRYMYAFTGGWLGEVYNVPWEGINAGITKTFISSSSNPLEERYAFPWNGTLPPGLRSSRDGFVI
jgi:hypothetical protein